MPSLPQLLAGPQALIMGVLNVTPDSFYDGNRYLALEKAVDHAKQLADEGADILDIGGESSRPGAQPVSEAEELQRLLPLLERLADDFPLPISIDTTKPAVADACLSRGAAMINDITALADPRMTEVAVRHQASVVLMHMRGSPRTMQDDCHYIDVVQEIFAYLQQRVDAARQAGLSNIVVDPGLGFGKTAKQNFELLRRLPEFQPLHCPILVGPSRKSFLASLPGRPQADDRLPGTLAAVTAAVFHGARIVRVHDVKECRQALDVIEAMQSS